jgi:hypothetical protein
MHWLMIDPYEVLRKQGRDERGTARPSFLLAEAARSECAPSMRAVKDSLAAPLRAKWGNSIGRPSPGLMARLGVPVGGRVRKLRAVEDQSAPIPEEITSELGGIGGNSQTILPARRTRTVKRIGRTPTLVLCSRNARPEKGLVRRPHVDQHGCPS